MKKFDNLKDLNINTTLYKTRLSEKFRNRKSYEPVNPHLITSFIPGTIVEVMVKEGQKVSKGDELLILDAMKMQNRLKSPADAIVKSISVEKGARVPKGTILLELDF